MASKFYITSKELNFLKHNLNCLFPSLVSKTNFETKLLLLLAHNIYINLQQIDFHTIFLPTFKVIFQFEYIWCIRTLKLAIIIIRMT